MHRPTKVKILYHWLFSMCQKANLPHDPVCSWTYRLLWKHNYIISCTVRWQGLGNLFTAVANHATPSQSGRPQPKGSRRHDSPQPCTSFQVPCQRAWGGMIRHSREQVFKFPAKGLGGGIICHSREQVSKSPAT